MPTAPKTEPSPRKQSSNQHKCFMESKVRHRKDQETTDFSSNEKTKPQGDEVLSSRSHPQLSTKLKDRPTFLTESLLVPSWCEMLDTEIILEGTEHRGNPGWRGEGLQHQRVCESPLPAANSRAAHPALPSPPLSSPPFRDLDTSSI